MADEVESRAAISVSPTRRHRVLPNRTEGHDANFPLSVPGFIQSRRCDRDNVIRTPRT